MVGGVGEQGVPERATAGGVGEPAPVVAVPVDAGDPRGRREQVGADDVRGLAPGRDGSRGEVSRRGTGRQPVVDLGGPQRQRGRDVRGGEAVPHVAQHRDGVLGSAGARAVRRLRVEAECGHVEVAPDRPAADPLRDVRRQPAPLPGQPYGERGRDDGGGRVDLVAHLVDDLRQLGQLGRRTGPERRHVALVPDLVVDDATAALEAAVAGHGGADEVAVAGEIGRREGRRVGVERRGHRQDQRDLGVVCLGRPDQGVEATPVVDAGRGLDVTPGDTGVPEADRAEVEATVGQGRGVVDPEEAGRDMDPRPVRGARIGGSLSGQRDQAGEREHRAEDPAHAGDDLSVAPHMWCGLPPRPA